MSKYFWKRGTGKTTSAYILSIETGKHILTYSRVAKRRLEDRAKRDNTLLPEVYLPEDIVAYGTKFNHNITQEVIIDEAQLVLDRILSWFNIQGIVQFYGVE